MICMKTELIASLSDVAAIIVECSVCKAQLKVPLWAPLVQRDAQHVPLTQCAVCLSPFDSTLLVHINMFIQTLDIHHGHETISLLLKAEDQATKRG
jgi:hypothetical protein